VRVEHAVQGSQVGCITVASNMVRLWRSCCRNVLWALQTHQRAGLQPLPGPAGLHGPPPPRQLPGLPQIQHRTKQAREASSTEQLFNNVLDCLDLCCVRFYVVKKKKLFWHCERSLKKGFHHTFLSRPENVPNVAIRPGLEKYRHHVQWNCTKMYSVQQWSTMYSVQQWSTMYGVQKCTTMYSVKKFTTLYSVQQCSKMYSVQQCTVYTILYSRNQVWSVI